MPGGATLATLLPALALLGLFDFDLGRSPDSERLEIAGNRVTLRPGILELRPFVQDLLVAELLCLIMVWFGVRELLASATHLVPLWDPQVAAPLGGVSVGRCLGHSLVGTCLLALGSSGLFRAGMTTGVTLDREALHLYRILLGVLRMETRSFPRASLERFEFRRSNRHPRPFQVLARRAAPERPVLVLSLVPAVGRSGALGHELEVLVKHLNVQLGVETMVGRRLEQAATSPTGWSLDGATSRSAPPGSTVAMEIEVEQLEERLDMVRALRRHAASPPSPPRSRRGGRTVVAHRQARAALRLARRRRSARARRRG